jgi:hypothetical protein
LRSRIAPRSQLKKDSSRKISKQALPELPDPRRVRTEEEYLEIICRNCGVVRSDLKDHRPLRTFFEMALQGDTGVSALADGRKTLDLARGHLKTILGDEELAVKALRDVIGINVKHAGPLADGTLAFLRQTAGFSL